MLMRKYILFFALVLLFFGMLGQNVSTFLMDKLSEQSTVEMSAVVSNVGCNVTDENVYWSIGVKEPSGELLINSSVRCSDYGNIRSGSDNNLPHGYFYRSTVS